MAADGAYLLNCTKDGDKRSAVAYYKDFILDGGNDGHQPDAFAYTSYGSFTSWEGEGRTGSVELHKNILLISVLDVTFSSGICFNWDIWGTTDCSSPLPVSSEAGTAGHYLYQKWKVFKDDDKKLFVNADGYTCSKIYFVN